MHRKENNMAEGSFFQHFIAGALIILFLCVTTMVGFIVWALWSAGLGVFTIVLTSVLAFCWVTHKVVLVGRKYDWWEF